MSKSFTRRCNCMVKPRSYTVLVLVGNEAVEHLLTFWGGVDAEVIREALRLDRDTPIIYEILVSKDSSSAASGAVPSSKLEESVDRRDYLRGEMPQAAAKTGDPCEPNKQGRDQTVKQRFEPLPKRLFALFKPVFGD